jgi:hypothetical protein
MSKSGKVVCRQRHGDRPPKRTEDLLCNFPTAHATRMANLTESQRQQTFGLYNATAAKKPKIEDDKQKLCEEARVMARRKQVVDREATLQREHPQRSSSNTEQMLAKLLAGVEVLTSKVQLIEARIGTLEEVKQKITQIFEGNKIKVCTYVHVCAKRPASQY